MCGLVDFKRCLLSPLVCCTRMSSAFELICLSDWWQDERLHFEEVRAGVSRPAALYSSSCQKHLARHVWKPHCHPDPVIAWRGCFLTMGHFWACYCPRHCVQFTLRLRGTQSKQWTNSESCLKWIHHCCQGILTALYSCGVNKEAGGTAISIVAVEEDAPLVGLMKRILHFRSPNFNFSLVLAIH